MAIHMAQKPDPQTGCVNTPIYLATTYAQKAPNELFSCYDYSRSFNPTRDVLEKCIQSLEFSDYALTFSSGVSAINCVLSLLKVNYIIKFYIKYILIHTYINNLYKINYFI